MYFLQIYNNKIEVTTNCYIKKKTNGGLCDTIVFSKQIHLLLLGTLGFE